MEHDITFANDHQTGITWTRNQPSEIDIKKDASAGAADGIVFVPQTCKKASHQTKYQRSEHFQLSEVTTFDIFAPNCP